MDDLPGASLLEVPPTGGVDAKEMGGVDAQNSWENPNPQSHNRFVK